MRQKENLSQTLSFLRLAMANAPDAVVFHDFQGKILYANRTAIDSLGYSETELLGMVVMELDAAYPDLEKLQRIWKSLKDKKSQTIKGLHRKKQGGTVPVEIHLSSLDLSDGFYILGHVRDITIQEDALAQARESEEKFTLAFENAKDAMFIMDETHRFINCNHQAQVFTGYSREEIVGKSPGIFSPEIQPGGQSSRDLVMENALKIQEGVEFHFEWFVRRKDGFEYPVEVSLSPINLGDAPHIFAVARDISQRKAYERELKEALETKTVLLRELQHRTRNNMQIVTSMLNLISSHTEDPDAIHAYLETANRIQVMALVYEKLVEDSNLSIISLEGYFRELVVHVSRNFREKAQGIQFHLNLENVRISMDAAIPLGMILNELLTNALFHAFPQGKGDVWITVHRSGSRVSMTVRDNGVGVPGGFDWNRQQALGLKTALSLAQGQLGGELNFSSGLGLLVSFSFDDEKYIHRI